MEQSSEREEPLHSQEELAEGLPEGYPLRREHLHDVEPLPSELQKRLDKIATQNLGEGPHNKNSNKGK